MPRLMLLAAAVVGACLVLAATAYADETETPTASPEPPAVETAVAPSSEETPTSPAEEPATPDAEEPAVPVDETPRAEEPVPPDEPTGDEGEVIAPAPDEEQVIAPAPDEEPLIAPAPAEESAIAPPPSGAGSPSGGSWPWWPLAIAGAAAAGAASVLLAYQGRKAKP
jgi:outer membrane biosynthesis protein TonB